MSQLPEDYFEICYIHLIRNFARFINVLPYSLNDGLGSLYCRSIFGAYHTLKTFIKETPQADCLWRYAVFSAALLKACNVPAKIYQVNIADAEGVFLKKWNPFAGPICNGMNQFCKLFSLKTLFAQNHAILMGMLVQQIMPTQGLQWLQTNGDLFSQWLDCLQSEVESSGVLGEALEALLDDADLIANQDERLSVELIETPETLAGEALDQLIREAIENGDVKINTPDSPIQIIKDGLTDLLFIEQGVIKDFRSKLAMFTTSAAGAVAMASAIFGNSDQHTLIFTMPGLGNRNSSLMGGIPTQLKSGTFRSAGEYFNKNAIPAKSVFAKQNNTNTNLAKQSLETIIDGPKQASYKDSKPTFTRAR